MQFQDKDVPQKRLGVWDTASLLIGIVIGAAIFKTPALVFSNVENATTGLLIWVVGAALSFCGALCYSELATTYPNFGGEYQYLSQAYGRRTGFLFAWMQLCVILTGSIGAMAFVFADYCEVFVKELPNAVVASLALVTLGLIHAYGVRTGKTVQNVLTLIKIIALGAILVAGLLVNNDLSAQNAVRPVDASGPSANLGLALVFVLYAYGGWNDAAMVTPEVRNHQRNMPRALLFGLGLTALLYLALNLSFLRVLGFQGVRDSSVPAADVVAIVVGRPASVVMSLIVMCSALGAIHGMLFASCRLLAAVGEDYVLFERWSRWNKRGVPLMSLVSIVGISLILILAVGTESGRAWVSELATRIGFPRPDWDHYFGGFETLIAATAPVFWGFFAMSGFAVMVLRFTDRDRERPFRVPFYPWPVVIFCGSSIFMLWKSLVYAKELTLLSLPVFLFGILISFTKRRVPDSSLK